ncbi:S9 family peptidase [Bacteroidota bacterium]
MIYQRTLKNLILSLVFVLLIIGCSKEKEMPKDVKPPVAEKIRKELTIHDHTRIDNYYWLNERENPKVIEYLEAENAYKDTMLAHTKGFQEEIYNEIIDRIKQTDESVPYKDNGYFYYYRYEEGKEYPIYCRKKDNMDNEEEIMLNVNEMAEGYDFYRVVGLSVSMDNMYLSYGVDTLSRRKYDIYVKDLTTGETLSDKMSNTTGRATWANDNKTIFYQLKDETLRSYKILRHILGSDSKGDVEIYSEDDATFSTYMYKTKSKLYLIIGSYSTLSQEYRFLDASDPLGDFTILQPRERELEYSVSHFGDNFYILTNLDAKNFRLMVTPVNKTTKENWKEVIPHREDVLLENIEIFKDYLVVDERKNGLTQLRIIKWEDNSEHYLDFGEETYMAYISTNREYDTKLLRYGYTSLTTPNSTFDYDMVNKEKELLKQQEVLGDFSSENYHAERIYAKATDGAEVPVSLVYRKGLEKNGDNPLLLYAYGSYGGSMDPSFRSDRLSILDRGFVYAIAHVRGGQELGRDWYENGKLFNKKNTFTDFIACAEHLVDQKFTNPEKLFAYGGSAGGLLIGAVANMKPDLFRAVLAAVPFVDVITTMLDESIPLTTGEYDEWGNPNEKEYYDYILSYSPYDNIEAKEYPAMLVTTGLHDSQVQYWEPAKWVAKLREMKTDDNLLIMDCDMGAGHGGASGRFKRYKRTALQFVFMFDLLGIKE